MTAEVASLTNLGGFGAHHTLLELFKWTSVMKAVR